jgi:hypothetical protein
LGVRAYYSGSGHVGRRPAGKASAELVDTWQINWSQLGENDASTVELFVAIGNTRNIELKVRAALD